MQDSMWIDRISRRLAVRRSRRAALSGGALAAAALVVGGARPRGAFACASDFDCNGGEFCSVVAEECLAEGSCAGDADCSSTQVCFSDATCGTPQCQSDSACAENEVCSDYLCVPDPSIGCVDDLDCEQNERCDDGQCVVVVVACEIDGDCDADETCSEGFCIPVKGFCSGHGDCGSNELCVSGVCVPDDDPGDDGDGGGLPVCDEGDDACELANVTGLPNTGAGVAVGGGGLAPVGLAALAGAVAWRVRALAARG